MQPKNILLFITDQQRADCIPGWLPESVHTPNLQWLMGHGVNFRRAYCTSPLCTPARGSILTGRQPAESGIVANFEPGKSALPLQGDFRTIGHAMQERGWETAYSGKWHLPTGSARPGFQHVLGRQSRWDVDSPCDDDAISQAHRWGVKLGDNYSSYLRNEGEFHAFHGRSTRLPLNAFPSTQMALQSASWLRETVRHTQPFFLAYSCVEPHPMGLRYDVAPAPFDRMYSPSDFELPTNTRQSSEFLEDLGFPALKSTASFSDEILKEMIASYMGAVSYADFLLGLLLEALAANDLLKDTLIFFTSDHGEMLCHHGLLKKGPVLYEDLIRIPLIVSHPDLTPHEHSGLVSHLDIFPTITQEAKGLPGKSLWPALIENKKVRDDTGIVVEYHSCEWGEKSFPRRAYIEEDWKLVVTPEGPAELYYLKADPEEERNLCHSENDEALRMKNRLQEQMDMLGDSWPQIANP